MLYMCKDTSKIEIEAATQPQSINRVKELRGWRASIVWLAAILFRTWSATLRIRPDDETRRLLQQLPESASVVVLWHNQLFASPRFYQRYIIGRQPAALISPSGDGAWLAALLRQVGIEPVRGSSHRRGVQALRELKQKHSKGCDLVITPDGSKGPCYKMKAGAAHLALESDSPVALLVLLSRYNIRLPTWDRFKIPLPFSKVVVRMRIVNNLREHCQGEVEKARCYLEEALNALSS